MAVNGGTARPTEPGCFSHFSLSIAQVVPTSVVPYASDSTGPTKSAPSRVSVVADGLGLNMTVQSYLDNLEFGLISCRELAPDLWHLSDLLTVAMDDLLSAAADAPTPADATTSPPGRDASSRRSAGTASTHPRAVPAGRRSR